MSAAISQRDVVSVSKTTALLALVGALAAPIATGAVMHYRVGEAERRIEKLERIVDAQTEILARIDENVKALKEKHVSDR
jgi:hypothetical protein